VTTPVMQGAPSAITQVRPAVAAPRTAERLRALVLGPRGGGTTRRRASDAFVLQDQAVAAVFIQRLFTAYLPPIWGWVTLAWMKRPAYV